jgi:hypothetical protein
LQLQSFDFFITKVFLLVFPFCIALLEQKNVRTFFYKHIGLIVSDNLLILIASTKSKSQLHSKIFLAMSLPLFISSRNIGRRTPKPGKPPILPPAKKVLYKVVHPPWMKPEDVKELLWRRHTYNNAVVSLRKVLKKEIEAKEAAGLGVEAQGEREKEELNELISENERRNNEVALKRYVLIK